jgi:hypothetical protein
MCRIAKRAAEVLSVPLLPPGESVRPSYQKFPLVGTDIKVQQLGRRQARSVACRELEPGPSGRPACATHLRLGAMQPDGRPLQEATPSSLPLLQHFTGQKRSSLCQRDVHCAAAFGGVAKCTREVAMSR